MGYIPKDAEWYIAELVQELRVADDPRNFVWRNMTLIRADSPIEAYEKAIRLGSEGETEYDNSYGKRVTIKFRGISQLEVIFDKLEDGAELLFRSQESVSQEQIAEMICRREELGVFSPIKPLEGPDVVSAEISEELKKRFGRT